MYSRVREILKQKLDQLRFPSEAFGQHSLRVGGATAAAKSGVPDRLFKRHGRWKNENAKDGYVEDPLSERLAVWTLSRISCFCKLFSHVCFFFSYRDNILPSLLLYGYYK